MASESGVLLRPFRFRDLRSGPAVDYVRRGGSIYDIQRHPGFCSVTMTEPYLDVLTAAQQSHAKGAASRNGGTETAVCRVLF
ncbi:hypothetical protein CHELA40_14770 [Chelatococcus asaccharovorans]|nr:hypothetical protein CHELA17_60851 [Chelatococcus asaccharovorans]CAH1679856.1 hypothetical protein CHELA40_14770 [Chelatococcus asaccharovorans]